MVEKTKDSVAPEPSATDSKDRKPDSGKSVSPEGNEDPEAGANKDKANGGTTSQSDANSTVADCNSTGAVMQSAVGAFAITNPLSNATNPPDTSLPSVNFTSEQSSSTPPTNSYTHDSSNNEVVPSVTVSAEPVLIAVAAPMDATDADTNDPEQNNASEEEHKTQGLVGVVALIVVGLAIVLSVFFSRRSGSPVVDPEITEPTPEEEILMLKRRSDMIEFLGELVDPKALDPNLPTYSFDRVGALQWIVEDDPMQLPIPTPEDRENNDQSVRKLKERYLMALLYYSLNGEQWEEDYNFFSQYDVCRWTNAWIETPNNMFSDGAIIVKGVICDQDDQVVGLQMWWNNLSGTIPDEMSYFSETMKEINLTGGSISGTIPSSLGRFIKLENLSIGDNCFSGPIPYGITEIPSLGVLISNNNNHQLEGSLEDFCSDDGSYREGMIAVSVDDSVDCTCCLRCFPEEFECYIPPYFNATFSTLSINGLQAFDSKNNTKQLMTQCLSPEQREFIEEECPCLIQITSEFDAMIPLHHICVNCTEPYSRSTLPSDLN